MGTYGYAAPEYVMTGMVPYISKNALFVNPTCNYDFLKGPVPNTCQIYLLLPVMKAYLQIIA